MFSFTKEWQVEVKVNYFYNDLFNCKKTISGLRDVRDFLFPFYFQLINLKSKTCQSATLKFYFFETFSNF